MIYWLNYKFIVVICVCVFFWGVIYVYRLTLVFEKHKKKKKNYLIKLTIYIWAFLSKILILSRSLLSVIYAIIIIQVRKGFFLSNFKV